MGELDISVVFAGVTIIATYGVVESIFALV